MGLLHSVLRESMWTLDLQVLNWMSYGMIASGVAAFVSLCFIPAPFGRYTSATWGRLINAKVSWFVQELPSFIVPIFLWSTSSRQPLQLTNKILLLAYVGHYAHRSLIYPWLLKGGKPSPSSVVLMAFTFCTYNGLLQADYLLNHAVYPVDWISSPKFILGIVLFLSGMAINIHSDHTLRTLRRPGETGYKIPTGGMFNYISGANFFGEIVEWTGLAIASWSLPAAAFAFFTFCNIGPRAVSHHKWYLSKFDNYPKNRKALIPFVY